MPAPLLHFTCWKVKLSDVLGTFRELMGTTNKSENKKMSKGNRDPASVEDAKTDGNLGEGGILKKGPWTSAEDAILVEYVKKHGEGNWNAVQKHSGLSRCGKSCRLRWANHLRPDLKKGAFTPEEEQRIIELHAAIGNKWARMASEVSAKFPIVFLFFVFCFVLFCFSVSIECYGSIYV
jgi:hypothetical protein